MKIGVPKEIKPQENRIGLTPESVKTLVSEGHEVIVENNGGFEAGFENEQYTNALVYCSFSKPASNPPLFSTITSWPSETKVLTLSGVSPILFSCGLISLGTPIFITLLSLLIIKKLISFFGFFDS